MLHLYGQGTAKNLQEATRLLVELSLKEDADAQELLGRILISQKKDIEGLAYLVASVRNGNAAIKNQVDYHVATYSKEQQNLISRKANELTIKN